MSGIKKALVGLVIVIVACTIGLNWSKLKPSYDESKQTVSQTSQSAVNFHKKVADEPFARGLDTFLEISIWIGVIIFIIWMIRIITGKVGASSWNWKFWKRTPPTPPPVTPGAPTGAPAAAAAAKKKDPLIWRACMFLGRSFVVLWVIWFILVVAWYVPQVMKAYDYKNQHRVGGEVVGETVTVALAPTAQKWQVLWSVPENEARYSGDPTQGLDSGKFVEYHKYKFVATAEIADGTLAHFEWDKRHELGVWQSTEGTGSFYIVEDPFQESRKAKGYYPTRITLRTSVGIKETKFDSGFDRIVDFVAVTSD